MVLKTSEGIYILIFFVVKGLPLKSLDWKRLNLWSSFSLERARRKHLKIVFYRSTKCFSRTYTALRCVWTTALFKTQKAKKTKQNTTKENRSNPSGFLPPDVCFLPVYLPDRIVINRIKFYPRRFGGSERNGPISLASLATTRCARQRRCYKIINISPVTPCALPKSPANAQ